MQAHARSPSLSHYSAAGHQHHSFASSSEDSYGRLQSHSRSESGTSQTNYDDPLASPPRRALMDEYTRPAPAPSMLPRRPKSTVSRQSTDAALHDPMTMHLLLEDAMDDSQQFQILSPEALMSLKKEQFSLSKKIESAKKKLHLETRMHSTAQSLQRLDSRSGASKYNPPSSLGKRRSSGASDTVNGGHSLDISTISKKCEELAHNVWRLERRQAELQDRRLSHIAGVLQLNYRTQAQRSAEPPDLDDEDGEDEPQLDFVDRGVVDRGDSPPNLKARLQDLGGELYSLISQSGPYKRAGFTEPPDASATTDDELAYVEMGLNTVKGLYDGLVTYSEQAIEKVRRHEQASAVLPGLWDAVVAGDGHLKRGLGSSPEGQRELDDEDSSDEDIDEDEEFSIQAFSTRVHRLCSRATAMSEQHQALQQDLAGHQATFSRSTAALEDAQTQLATSLADLAAAEQRAATHEASAGEISQNMAQMESDKAGMEAEIVRLQTELTVARAELDGAYGTRAQRALEGQGHPDAQRELEELITKNSDLMEQNAEIEDRVDMLQKELREMVGEHEALVKQSVEAEKERESLEGLVDTLREHIEEAQAKLSDERVKAMGRNVVKPANGSETAGRPAELTSVGFMRSEFKKMMRDARAEHFKSLKAEQEERRRLEATIRSLRKDQAAAAASSAQTPPVQTKSGLSKAVAAS